MKYSYIVKHYFLSNEFFPKTYNIIAYIGLNLSLKRDTLRCALICLLFNVRENKNLLSVLKRQDKKSIHFDVGEKEVLIANYRDDD